MGFTYLEQQRKLKEIAARLSSMPEQPKEKRVFTFREGVEVYNHLKGMHDLLSILVPNQPVPLSIKGRMIKHKDALRILIGRNDVSDDRLFYLADYARQSAESAAGLVDVYSGNKVQMHNEFFGKWHELEEIAISRGYVLRGISIA